ncbi:Hypothetical predicted protein [Olea europaea subsp. europaea]|uniref:Uncharacterized protein n=1 Tax=Olea europaea subsp. europaea TaxID=158383 RepID=A0A8S0U137_OLEEU|nr:Hypothetical predicted protein [Olea europaea subsp. europaea]
MAIQEVQTSSKELNLQDLEICCILQQSTPAFFEIEKLKSMLITLNVLLKSISNASIRAYIQYLLAVRNEEFLECLLGFALPLFPNLKEE